MKKEIHIHLPSPDIEKEDKVIEGKYETAESEDGRMKQVNFRLVFRKVSSNNRVKEE